MEHRRLAKGYQKAMGLSLNCPACSISPLLVKEYALNHQLFIGVQYSHSNLLYTYMCGYCR